MRQYPLIATILLVAACGATPSNNTADGGTSGTSSDAGTTGTTGNGSDGGTTTTTSCDGLAFKNASGNEVDVSAFTYLGSSWKTNCAAQLAEASVPAIRGVWAVSSDDKKSSVLFATSCGDLDGTSPTGGTAATGGTGTTIAAAQASWTGNVTVNGVVVAAGKANAKGSFSFFIEDQTAAGAAPAASSGVDVYVKGGGTIAPTQAPAVGAYVTVAGAATVYNGMNEINATALTAVSSGAALPTGYAITDASLAGTGNSAELKPYVGMLVKVQGPLTPEPSGACPASLTYTSTSKGG